MLVIGCVSYNMLMFMFHEEQTRPGQVAMSFIKNDDLPPNKLRILVKRYLGNPS